jgi:2-C-methyl-D-erythritol 2,4-cyclodiphosphate synthase
MLSREGWRLVNLDLTIACELPKISPHVQAMRETLSGALQSQLDSVSVKATTTEKLGFCGRGEGIAALAVVLIQRDK